VRKNAMEEIYLTYAPTVFKYLICLSHDRSLAEDLTADTFETAFRSIEKYRGDSKLSVWLCGIAKNLYRAEKRRISKVQWTEIEKEPLISPQDIELDYALKEEKISLYKELQLLPPDMREVFYLRMTGDMTFDEIGDILGKSGNWARVTFYRGKEKLKRRMQDDGE